MTAPLLWHEALNQFQRAVTLRLPIGITPDWVQIEFCFGAGATVEETVEAIKEMAWR